MAEGSEKQEMQVYVLFRTFAGSRTRVRLASVICFVSTQGTTRKDALQPIALRLRIMMLEK